jgi:altronate hydrolase
VTARAIHLHELDAIAVVLDPATTGEQLVIGELVVDVRQDIPMGHKIALRTIEQGEDVRRYGEVIGHATQHVEPGEHVHTHNLVGNRLSVEGAP